MGIEQTDLPLHTINSSMPQRLSSPTNSRKDPQKTATIALLLSRLAVHFYRPDFTEAQAKSMISDMVGDLADLAVCDIEKAIEAYRKTAFPMGKFKPFPDSGTLRKLAADELKRRAELGMRGRKRTEWDPPRANMWWVQDRPLWQPHWRETEVPAGEKVRDQATNQWRDPERLVL